MKPTVLRPQAEVDLLDVTQWYEERGGAPLAERFFDSARAAIDEIERMPGMGSPRLLGERQDIAAILAAGLD